MSNTAPKHIPSLLAIFDKINNRHFNGIICAGIRWGRLTSKEDHIIWGMVDFSSRIITINKILQHPDVPDYVLESVILHECLHLLYPPSVAIFDGHKETVHSDRFLAMEKLFPILEQGRRWEEDNFDSLISKTKRKNKKENKT